MNRHELAERRSLALHRAVAARLRAEPRLVERARARLLDWSRAGLCAPSYLERWRELLSLPVRDLAAFLESDTDEARTLRQSTPFAGVIDARARWRIWREVASEAER